MNYDSNFDGQKLMYHPERTSDWLREGRSAGPIYTELELTRQCNCDCVFCGVDYQVNSDDSVLSAEDGRRIVDELAGAGNRSVMFSGHGEPLMNPAADEIVSHCSSIMSTSLTTNGLLLDRDRLPMLDGLEWIRFSVNGGSPEVYAAIHGVGAECYESVLSNIQGAVERKIRRELDVTIGVQMVLLDGNADTAVKLAGRVKSMGVDYFSLKPYSQHPLCGKKISIDYACHDELIDEIAGFADDSFSVSCRRGSISRLGVSKPYGTCYGTDFLSFISANGDVWECNVFAGDDRFFTGNANEESISSIWFGERRRKVLEFIRNGLNLDECRDVCRMDACNRYLWRLKNPMEHDNFI